MIDLTNESKPKLVLQVWTRESGGHEQWKDYHSAFNRREIDFHIDGWKAGHMSMVWRIITRSETIVEAFLPRTPGRPWAVM